MMRMLKRETAEGGKRNGKREGERRRARVMQMFIYITENFRDGLPYQQNLVSVRKTIDEFPPENWKSSLYTVSICSRCKEGCVRA